MTRLVAAIVTTIVLAAIPAQATTFTEPKVIYAAAGAANSGDAPVHAGTSVPCTNLSGQAAVVRWRYFNAAGVIAGSLTLTVQNGETRFGASENGTTIYTDTIALTGAFQGRVVVYSTQSGVFCSAIVGHPTGSEPIGVHLHMVRFNAHPGTVE